MNELTIIAIDYDVERLTGTLTNTADPTSSLWDRLRQSSSSMEGLKLSDNSISLPWPGVLSLIRQFAPLQKRYGFRFRPDETARTQIDKFLVQYKSVKTSRSILPATIDKEDIQSRLMRLGFTRRKLRPFQMRDLRRLASLQNGANFSVPGAGKTTVTFALHLLTRRENQKLVVICPKSAFEAWNDVVGECIADDAPEWVREPFVVLTGRSSEVTAGLLSPSNRLAFNYEQLLSIPDIFIRFLAQNPIHLVLDESHRMKGGTTVKRGAVLLNTASLPVRRDILSGTPMPQSSNDLRSQVDFLWPGVGLGNQIVEGKPPRDVITNLYVRTTKRELNLPPITRHFIPVEMSRGQRALYGICRSEALRDLSSLRSGSRVDVVRARRSVMRLLQLSSNPILVASTMLNESPNINSGIIMQVLDEGPSTKMIEVRNQARKLAREGRKSVIWSIFVDTIKQMRFMLADLNPAVIYGAVPSGSPEESESREGQLKRFHEDPTCMTFIANPAAVGEGINLHQVCHDALYLDRSYNTTHYVQSIDRIHRLGLSQDTETNVFIFQTTAPRGLGCVDHSVSRRLTEKVRAMQQLLDDEDLHQIALDEEDAEDPIDYSSDLEDIADLIDELEGSTIYREGERL